MAIATITFTDIEDGKIHSHLEFDGEGMSGQSPSPAQIAAMIAMEAIANHNRLQREEPDEDE